MGSPQQSIGSGKARCDRVLTFLFPGLSMHTYVAVAIADSFGDDGHPIACLALVDFRVWRRDPSERFEGVLTI